MNEETCPYCGNEQALISQCDKCGVMFCDECIVPHEVEVVPTRVAPGTGKPAVPLKCLCPFCDGRDGSGKGL